MEWLDKASAVLDRLSTRPRAIHILLGVVVICLTVVVTAIFA